jgi:hypothetical protein
MELLKSFKIDNVEKVNETEFKLSLSFLIDPVEVVNLK